MLVRSFAAPGQDVAAHDSAPLTYRAWLRQRLDRDFEGDFGLIRVQYMRRGLKGCGVVVDASMSDIGSDWFKVRATDGGVSGWLPGTKVRICSGDNRCACEHAEAAGGAPACGVKPAASAVPPGNTGTTVVEGA